MKIALDGDGYSPQANAPRPAAGARRRSAAPWQRRGTHGGALREALARWTPAAVLWSPREGLGQTPQLRAEARWHLGNACKRGRVPCVCASLFDGAAGVCVRRSQSAAAPALELDARASHAGFDACTQVDMTGSGAKVPTMKSRGFCPCSRSSAHFR